MKLSQSRPCYITLNAKAMQHNLERVRELTPTSKVMSVVKADAYGHGMELAVGALNASDGFGVSSLDDARRVRSVNIELPITVLSANLNVQELNHFGDLSKGMQNIRYTVFDHQQLAALADCKPESPFSVWLKVDTGMGRLGFRPDEIEKVLAQLTTFECISDISLMSHLANADLPYAKANQLQCDKFAALIEQFDFKQSSLLNSAGVCGLAKAAHNVVRPGLMLYGISPLADTSRQELGLQPVMSFYSKLISVKTIKAGYTIGYGSTFRTDTDIKIGIVACGYGDGYPRHAKHGTPVMINGQRAGLVGRVSMDMIAVDLTGTSASVGDTALLWGEDLPIEEIAGCCETIAYELSCRIPDRVERIVI